MNQSLASLLLAVTFIQLVAAVPDEAVGRVAVVMGGDSFGIEIQLPDNRTQYIDRVKLADIEAPSTLTPKGEAAKEYATSLLKNRTVFLDIDDNSIGGRDDQGLLICVVYLMDSNLKPVWPCVNRAIVDAGHAIVRDDRKNEFNSTVWWGDKPDLKVTRSLVTKKQQESQKVPVIKIDTKSKMVSLGNRARYST